MAMGRSGVGGRLRGRLLVDRPLSGFISAPLNFDGHIVRSVLPCPTNGVRRGATGLLEVDDDVATLAERIRDGDGAAYLTAMFVPVTLPGFARAELEGRHRGRLTLPGTTRRRRG